MQAAITELSGLGFSESEARAYTQLLISGPATGYQLAREAGIARPNIYPILDRLEARGAIIRIETEGGGSRYEALPVARMLERIAGETRRRLSGAEAAFASLQSRSQASESVWNLVGRAAVLSRARELIDAASDSLLAGLWATEAEELGDALAAAVARGVRVTTLCIQGCVDECGGCAGDVYRYAVEGAGSRRSLILAARNAGLLVAQIDAADGLRGVVTNLEVMNGLASGYLRNAIAAAEIVRSLGPDLASLVDAPARRAIEGAGLAADGRSW
ncbi:MAG TPA: helix-turn-helix domain-containing protein, partial [Dehalococcoidia bacterium]